MRDSKRVIRLLLAAALLLGTTAMLLQQVEADPTSMSTLEWVRTPEAASQDDKCRDPEVCWELCERFGSFVVPLGTFECR